jgi:hypothetical protein
MTGRLTHRWLRRHFRNGPFVFVKSSSALEPTIPGPRTSDAAAV